MFGAFWIVLSRRLPRLEPKILRPKLGGYEEAELQHPSLRVRCFTADLVPVVLVRVLVRGVVVLIRPGEARRVSFSDQNTL